MFQGFCFSTESQRFNKQTIAAHLDAGSSCNGVRMRKCKFLVQPLRWESGFCELLFKKEKVVVLSQQMSRKCSRFLFNKIQYSIQFAGEWFRGFFCIADSQLFLQAPKLNFLSVAAQISKYNKTVPSVVIVVAVTSRATPSSDASFVSGRCQATDGAVAANVKVVVRWSEINTKNTIRKKVNEDVKKWREETREIRYNRENIEEKFVKKTEFFIKVRKIDGITLTLSTGDSRRQYQVRAIEEHYVVWENPLQRSFSFYLFIWRTLDH